MLAPTKPLVEQHYRFFRWFIAIDGSDPECALLSGRLPPDQRREEFFLAVVVCLCHSAGDQKRSPFGRLYPLSDVTLLVVDECHRAVGNYAYVFIASVWGRETAPFTAAPCHDRIPGWAGDESRGGLL